MQKIIAPVGIFSFKIWIAVAIPPAPPIKMPPGTRNMLYATAKKQPLINKFKISEKISVLLIPFIFFVIKAIIPF